ncbi:MAG: class I SAM-dependent methyltransferase [Armatimonadetes bacterium]|nr:class I SAM-dependent methyltransferase [Armatimonadota bacterium]
MQSDSDSAPDLNAGGAARLYRIRFDARAEQRNVGIWKVLCHSFFQRYVPETGTVVDLGAGSCEFINQIRAARRIAVDTNPQTRQRATPGVEVCDADIRTLDGLPRAFADVVFASNVLEHLPTKADLMAALRAAHAVLRPGGALLVMGPNIRFASREYWDFLDHHIALSDRSLREALEMAGFTVRELRPRFLPLSRLSRLPQHPFLVRLYLLCPPAHRVLGRQFFAVATR